MTQPASKNYPKNIKDNQDSKINKMVLCSNPAHDQCPYCGRDLK